MRENATPAGGLAGRILWPLLAAATGLALPGLIAVRVSDQISAGLIAVFAVTLLLPVIAGLTIPYPRSLWNVPVALQLAEVVFSVWVYFEFQDVLAKNPGGGQVILGIAIIRMVAIFWLYAINSAVAAWLLNVYQGLQIAITAAAVAVVIAYRHDTAYLVIYALLAAQAALRGAAIYFMHRALGKVREFRRKRRLTQAAPPPSVPDGVWR
jgi:hypothetical protein